MIVDYLLTLSILIGIILLLDYSDMKLGCYLITIITVIVLLPLIIPLYIFLTLLQLILVVLVKILRKLDSILRGFYYNGKL